MSHAVNIKTQIKNIDNLLDQFKKAGWQIVNFEKCRTYPGDPRREETHQYVAKNPVSSGYDVGINIDEEGSAFFVCDFFDPSIERQLGSKLKTIKQGYAVDELKKFMTEESLSYDINELPSGELVVTATN
jgi:hypothetical protein